MDLARPIRLVLIIGVGCVLSSCLEGCGVPGGALTSTPAGPPPGSPAVTVSSTTYPTQGSPFQAVVTPAGAVLVSVTANTSPGTQTGIEVFTPSAGGLHSSCVNPLSPFAVSQGGNYVANLSLLPGGVDVAGGIGEAGGIFYNVSQVEACNAMGYLVSQGSISQAEGTLGVVVTPDGKYAFVNNEYGIAPGASTKGNIGVVSLQYDSTGNVNTGTTLLGQISTGGAAIAGMRLSPDGTRLYVTSEVAAGSTIAAGVSNPVLFRSGCVQQPGAGATSGGLLSVINVAAAETAPGPSAIISTIYAGCSPVRAAETLDGKTLWVTARGDDRVLAFSTSLLESNPDNSLLGYAPTGGRAPVGLCLFHNDALLGVANSNRFGTGTANATILDVSSPSSAAVLTTISTGAFPREFTLGPDGSTLYLTNYNSDSLQVIATTVH